MPPISKKKLQDHTTCNRLDLGNTRILTNYAQKTPRTLHHMFRICVSIIGGWIKGLASP